MSIFFRVLAFLVIICSVSCTKTKPPVKCTKPNQVYSTNGNHPCQDTCEDPDFSKACCYSSGNYSGCICKPGFLKNYNGTCIPARLCRSCALLPNEEYSECGNHTCRTSCQFPISIASCSYSCVPGCICKEGYLRDYDGVCVYKDDCPPSCPYGERFETCGTACPVTCQNRNDPPTPCTTDCVEGCFCIKGFIRDTQSGQCIPEEDCPAPACTDPNAEYLSCKRCVGSCDNKNPICNTSCDPPGCYCKKGYIKRSSTDPTCIKESACPQVCPKNEEFDRCGTACPITCENKDDPPTSCTKKCVQGCFCKKGYVRDTKSGNCVLPKNCPAPLCGFNEVWLKNCAKYQDTCHESYDPELGTKPGCCCKNGYVREYTGGNCIRRRDCYNECGSWESDEKWD